MKNKKSVDVSFIIIEYHSLSDVLQCVNSIKEKCFNISHEIIISSNSTYDIPIQQALELRYPNINWSFNSQNNGFAYGMNCGISISNGEYIILQNPDTIIETNNLLEAINLLKQNKNIGLIGPKIVNLKNEVQDSCRTFLTPKTLFKRTIKRFLYKKHSILETDFNYDSTQSVNWVIGAFMIFSKQSIDKVGLLNEKFFMYVEDMDLCLRFWENNLKVIYFPKLVIKYEGDRKSTKNNLLSFNKYTFIHLKNYLFFLKTHGIKKINSLKKMTLNFVLELS